MSTLIVEVCKILNVQPHPNADRLDLVTIKGWNCITQKGSYKVNDLVVYAPIDSVLPIELSDAMGVTSYLSNQRVKTIKLRGVYSQGLIISLKFLPTASYAEGEDVKDLLGITKYINTSTISRRGKTCKSDDRFFKYTNIENIKNYPDVLQPNELVVITEKLNGSNFRATMLDGKIIYGSHNCQLSEDDTSLFTLAGKKYHFEDVLQEGDIIYGEVYGKGIQKMSYDLLDHQIRFFDYYSAQLGRFLDFYSFNAMCTSGDLPMVPVLCLDKWSTDLLSLANGKSTIASHIKEGIVIKPLTERWDIKLGRVILKHISEQYLSGKWED